MQLRFRTPTQERLAGQLGFSAEALVRCANAPTLEEGRGRLDQLRSSVKATYKQLALELHPDHNPGDAAKEEEFKLLSTTYSDVAKALETMEIRPRPVRPVVQIRVIQCHGVNATNTQVTTDGSAWFGSGTGTTGW